MRSAVNSRWTGRLRPKTLAGNLSVHGIRRQIDLTRPRDGAVVNKDLLEEPDVP